MAKQRFGDSSETDAFIVTMKNREKTKTLDTLETVRKIALDKKIIVCYILNMKTKNTNYRVISPDKTKGGKSE